MLSPKLTQIGSTVFLTPNNDMYIGKSLEVYGEWSHGELEALAAILNPDDNVVEIGSNIGSHTVFLGRDICPSGKIFAFEPRRIIFQMLCANLALNGVDNVEAYQLGCGDFKQTLKEGSLDFSQPINAGGFSIESIEGSSETIDIVKIDDFFDEDTKIALIKADVEGYEYKALLGAEKVISRNRPILYLENDRIDLSVQLLSYLNEINYDVWWHVVPLFRKNNRANFRANIFGEISSFNIICFPKEKNIQIEALSKVVDPNYHPLKK